MLHQFGHGVFQSPRSLRPWASISRRNGSWRASDSGKTPDFGYARMFIHWPSGLNLTWYRAYSPDLGRWLSRDPLGEQYGGLNLYDYVMNNPLNSIDLYGLKLTYCDCQKFLVDEIELIKHEATIKLWERVGEFAIMGTASLLLTPVVTPAGTVLLIGVSAGYAIYGIFKMMDEKVEEVQRVDRLFQMCRDSVAEH
jgi:RHS repeat-associated protein